jgi:hypothetical protein
LIVDLGPGLIALAIVQSRAGFQPGANPHHPWLVGLDAMGGKNRPHLPPPLLGEDTGMADGFAAAIGSAGAKREAQFERFAVPRTSSTLRA